MHSRIILVILFSVLAGFATTTQNSPDKFTLDEIDIDNDNLEGSGANREVSQDLESSGSGLGPDDEDLQPELKPIIPIQPKLQTPPTTKAPTEDTVPPGTNNHNTNDVIMNPKSDDRPTSFFAQPGILAAVIGGAVVGLLCAILVVMFIVYRMRKKDEGSYALEEQKRSPTSNSYSRGANNKEFYA